MQLPQSSANKKPDGSKGTHNWCQLWLWDDWSIHPQETPERTCRGHTVSYTHKCFYNLNYIEIFMMTQTRRDGEHRSYKPIACSLGTEDRADLFNDHKNPHQCTLLSHSAPQGGDTVQLAARSPRFPIKANVSWSRSWLQGTLRGNRTWWHKCRKSKHSGEVDKHDDLGLTLL